MKTAVKTTALLMCLTLAACETSQQAPSGDQGAPTPNVIEETPQSATVAASGNAPRVTDTFKRGGGNWQDFGSVVYRYTAIERNGEVYVCGAFTGRGSSEIRRLTREVMGQARVTSNGETLLRNVRFFREASNANFGTQLVGVETNCASTGRSTAEVPLDSVRVETREGRYRIRG